MSRAAENVIDAADRFGVSEPAIGWDENDRRAEEEQARIKARERHDEQAARLTAMGVPRRLHEDILAKPDASKAVLAMRAFHADVRLDKLHMAVLSGTAGVGKSLAAAAWLLHAANDAVPKLGPRRFITSADFCRISEYDNKALMAIQYARFLVLDDLGLEYGDRRKYHASRIDALINKRHGEMLPTVITTNLSMEEIASEEGYGERVGSRLNDAQVTLLRGEPDRRKR